jgi:hypothetical protein
LITINPTMKISRLYKLPAFFRVSLRSKNSFFPQRCRCGAGTRPAGQSAATGTAGTTYTLRRTISNSPCTASANDVVINFDQNPTTSRDYVAGTLCQNTSYRRTVISGSCTNNVSGVLLFKVVSAGTWTGAVSTAWQIRILYL